VRLFRSERDRARRARAAAEIEARFTRLSRARATGEPIAYIVGRREFYSLPLSVGPPC
jgi:release factor glutamine methyltransferase